MPTPEEIKKLAREYVNANWISESEAYYEGKRQIGIDDVLPIFMWISQRYCIVPKKKIAEWQGIVEDALKADPYITEPAWRFMWERLFGTALFNEEKE